MWGGGGTDPFAQHHQQRGGSHGHVGGIAGSAALDPAAAASHAALAASALAAYNDASANAAAFANAGGGEPPPGAAAVDPYVAQVAQQPQHHHHQPGQAPPPPSHHAPPYYGYGVGGGGEAAGAGYPPQPQQQQDPYSAGGGQQQQPDPYAAAAGQPPQQQQNSYYQQQALANAAVDAYRHQYDDRAPQQQHHPHHAQHQHQHQHRPHPHHQPQQQQQQHPMSPQGQRAAAYNGAFGGYPAEQAMGGGGGAGQPPPVASPYRAMDAEPRQPQPQHQPMQYSVEAGAPSPAGVGDNRDDSEESSSSESEEESEASSEEEDEPPKAAPATAPAPAPAPVAMNCPPSVAMNGPPSVVMNAPTGIISPIAVHAQGPGYIQAAEPRKDESSDEESSSEESSSSSSSSESSESDSDDEPVAATPVTPTATAVPPPPPFFNAPAPVPAAVKPVKKKPPPIKATGKAVPAPKKKPAQPRKRAPPKKKTAVSAVDPKTQQASGTAQAGKPSSVLSAIKRSPAKKSPPGKGKTFSPPGKGGVKRKAPGSSAKSTGSAAHSPARSSASRGGGGGGGGRTTAGIAATTPLLAWSNARRTEKPMTDAEYEQVKSLLEQFCSLPLLQEFTRPVSTLHPEMMSVYSKIIHHPMDLGTVCRRVHLGQYRHVRKFRVDVWRIFSNCVTFHSDARTLKEGVAIPSFISIALHLREYFNQLWTEFVVPSEDPRRMKELKQQHEKDSGSSGGKGADAPGSNDDLGGGNKNTKGKENGGKTKDTPSASASVMSTKLEPSVFHRREEARKKRLLTASATPLSPKCLRRTVAALESFLKQNGRVDALDTDEIGVGDFTGSADAAARVMEMVVTKIISIKDRLSTSAEWIARDEDANDGEGLTEEERGRRQVSVMDLHSLLAEIYDHELLSAPAANPALRYRFQARLTRLLHKVAVVPIYEAGCRGVNQSSIWGCMAAPIWARESSKRPYWPALVLGILAPEDQREDWHVTLTERNEARLPEKLRVGLAAGKKKAEQALRRKKDEEEQMSFFLIEFLGKHQFTWVREADIIENFDPKHDPNAISSPTLETGGGSGSGKKKRSLRGGGSHMHVDPEIFTTAVQECQWAAEEFEMQVQDPCGDLYSVGSSDDTEEGDDTDDDEDDAPKYSYSRLCRLPPTDSGMGDDATDTDDSDGDEEAEELFATEGLLDLSAAGRKKAKQRAAALKRRKEVADRKAKAEQLKKEKAQARKDMFAKKRAAAAAAKKQAEEKRKQQAEKRKREREEKEERERVKKRRKVAPKKVKKMATKSPTRSKYYVPKKRERAEAKVRAYLTNLANKGVLGGLGGGVATDRTETSGLLAMALAFRAAAGEITVNGLDDTSSSKKKPWDEINVDDEPNALVRCALLEKQIRLLEKEMGKLQEEEERRVQYIEEAKQRRADNMKELEMSQARQEENDKSRGGRQAKAKKVSNGSTPKTSPNSKGNDSGNAKGRKQEDIAPVVMAKVAMVGGDRNDANNGKKDTKMENGSATDESDSSSESSTEDEEDAVEEDAVAW